MTELKTKLVLRNDSTANWSANESVVLLKGEVGIEFLEDGKVKLKIGDGIKSWAELDYFGGTSENVEAALADLQKDVANINKVLFQPDDGAQTLLSRIEALEEGAENVDKKIEDSLNAFAEKITDDGTVNTLKELIDYVAAHGNETLAITSSIATLQDLIGGKSVAEQIGEASTSLLDEVNSVEAKLNAILEAQEYEIAYKPDGAIVDYRDKEIRVMCPKDTVWQTQSSGANADPSMYYIGFKAYAPNGAKSLKEDLAEIISDTKMYYFENNEFAGVDQYGRKYSVVWLPVAQYNQETSEWTYFGKKSNKSKYIGWYYSVEWYNNDGKKIGTDTIRINLSNEDCHNAIEPYYMGSINVNKLVQDENSALVLNGGSSIV